MDEMIHHLAVFVSKLWQIHVFGEENTRTTTVFFIQYLRTLGFNATNDIFAENALYFRNALVLANYNDLKKGNPLGHKISRTVFEKSIAWGTQSTSKPDMHVLEIKASRASELLKEM